MRDIFKDLVYKFIFFYLYFRKVNAIFCRSFKTKENDCAYKILKYPEMYLK